VRLASIHLPHGYVSYATWSGSRVSLCQSRYQGRINRLVVRLREVEYPDAMLSVKPTATRGLRACADRLATFYICRFSERLDRLLIAHGHIRYPPIRAASKPRGMVNSAMGPEDYISGSPTLARPERVEDPLAVLQMLAPEHAAQLGLATLYKIIAERTTRTYSNRFAAHIIKQHQFNALCGARGWKNKLRHMVDDEYPPAVRKMPAWGLRAEFWVESIGENYGTDTTEAGTYLYLATDQVRFYRMDVTENYAHAAGGGYFAGWHGQDAHYTPLVLEEIPPLVVSEVMRDVDLLVGVASVGNDPNWSDGGPEGRFRDYWTSYLFGGLSETARTRKQVLQCLTVAA
jgi:hypothetical protein